MEKEKVRDKDRQAFYLIVETYLKAGRPVSSEAIARKIDFRISSATVRNIMNKLEKNGFLYQPHTSSGRIPTDQGLRFYVNHLFKEAHQKQPPVEFPIHNLEIEKDDFDSLFISASKILSEYSDNIGFVISPPLSYLNFKHLRVVKISEEKLLLVLLTTSNIVFNRIIETKQFFTQPELDRACNYLNRNFAGKNLQVTLNYLVKEIPKYRMQVEDLLCKLEALLKTYIATEEKEAQIFLEGTSKLLDKSELSDMQRLKALFKQFEEKAKLAKLLSDFISLDRVRVLIGSELEYPDISECSLILSHYGYDSQVLGSLGIIGPKRIPYRKIIPLVDYMAKQLSHTFSSIH